jgi:hypothetical protein
MAVIRAVGLYNPGSVSLNLSWTSTGKPLNFPAEDGGTCTYRYGTATGSILLGGGVNLLATEGGTDRTETNIARKDRCIQGTSHIRRISCVAG